MSLATAYAINKRNSMKKGMANAKDPVPEKMAHGGKVCAHCGGMINPKLDESKKMFEGGEVEKEDYEDDSPDLLSVPEPHEEEASKKRRILASIFGSKKSDQ